MSSPKVRALARSILLCAAMLPLASQGAQGQPAALFATDAATPEAGAEPSRGQRRMARVDRGVLDALRDDVTSGRPGRLRLNLLQGADFTASLRRSAPTASGYTLSGPLEGVPFGRAVLVVNEGVAMGRVYTPGANYAIRTAGGVQEVERMAPQPLRCGAHGHDQAGTGITGWRRTTPRNRADSGQAAGELAPSAHADSAAGSGRATLNRKSAADDSDVVDVLVVYPSFVREIEGGYARMLALIDLDIATANEAYAASGVGLRVRLAAAEEVDYGWFRDSAWRDGLREETALEHLTAREDGHLDGVHELRDRHAADLVLLHMGGDGHDLFSNLFTGGIAWVVPDVTAEALERWGFSAAVSGDGTFVAHELGHSMGLNHDRHEGSRNRPFPYSHGFRYETARATWPDGTKATPFTFGTIMSQHSGIEYDNFVLAFSNPDLVHPDDPGIRLGVPGDEPSTEPDGPADAARHLNELRGVLANVRSSADADACTYELGGDQGKISAEGGTHRVRVETQPGCPWTAAGGEWVASVSPGAGTGSADIEYRVDANEIFQRPVEVLVAGRVHARPQAGSRPVTPVCERSLSMRSMLEDRHPDQECPFTPGFTDCTPCENLDFGPDYLAGIRTLYTYRNQGDRGFDGSEFRLGDFDGLTGLTDLKLHSLERLPRGLLFGLTGLRHLRIGAEFSWEPETAAPAEIEPGAFRGLPGLRELVIGPHRLERLGPGTFEGLSGLDRLTMGRPQGGALELEPGAFRGLPSLRVLFLRYSRIESIDPGVFKGLGRLAMLNLSGNELKSLPPGAFDGLPALEHLNLDRNRLSELRPGLLGELTGLRKLYLKFNRLADLQPGTFAGLSNLEYLHLSGNRLRNLPPGLFGDLASLETLVLRVNSLGRLRSGLFAGMGRLRYLYLQDAGITSIEPGAFDGLRDLGVLGLKENRLRELAPGAFRGLNLEGLHLTENPGAPFAFSPIPVPLPPPDPMEGLPMRLALEAVPEAPFRMTAELSATGGSLGTYSPRIRAGEARSGPIAVTPDGDGPVTVRTGRVRWPGEDGDGPQPSTGGGGGGLTFTIDLGYGYSGFRAAPGPPLVLHGFPDVALGRGGEPRTFDLPSVFAYFLGGAADYAAASDDEGVAAAGIDGRTLTVTPHGAGAAEVTVTATGPDGETMTRRFTVTVADDRPSVPLFLSGSHPDREGFARVLNRSGTAGEVRITAVDGEGARREPVALRLRPYGAVNFNSGDLEGGNPGKGLADGVGFGAGDWRLEFESDLDIDALAYVRTRDGFVTGMNATAPWSGGVRRVATFNPASNPRQLSRLRVVNRGRSPAAVAVRGIDDAGASPGGPVRFTVPAGGAREFDAVQLEAGGPELDGSLGDGEGKWRLTVESDAPLAVMGLLESTSTGHLTNLSSGPVRPDGGGTHHVALFPAASDPLGRQGFVRVVNRSDAAGTVRIAAFDDAGTEFGPLELSVGAGAAAHFNSDDLELGAAGKGLEGSAGPGGGDWRLELESALDIGVLAYVRTGDGFLTSVHDTVAVRDGRRLVATFNPGSNTGQVSVLRVANPTQREVEVTVVGTDDRGRAPTHRGDAAFTVPAGGTMALDAAALEAGLLAEWRRGNPHLQVPFPDSEAYANYWDREPLGDGAGKWRLSVATEPGLLVQSLLRTPTGHLTNLSPDGR